MIPARRWRRSNWIDEPDAMRDAYGRTEFGSGCLLARRLVEAGVTFVEVDINGWDTHDDNFDRVSKLVRPGRSAVRPS